MVDCSTPQPTKTCSKCGESKPLDAFALDRSKRNGRRPDCRACCGARARAYRDNLAAIAPPDLSALTPEQIERYWSHVDRSAGPDGCWPWTGSRLPTGYGQVTIGGRSLRAHRVAYALTVGPILPDKPHVLHRCDNPPCCNAERCLFAGTNADNMADRNAKGRQARVTGDRNGRRTRPEQTARGSRVNTAKLTEDQIPLVRAAIASGELQRNIAAAFGVSRQTISRLANNEIWRHVPSQQEA